MSHPPLSGCVEGRLRTAGLELPDVSPQGAYVPAVRHVDTVWTSGQLSRTASGVVTGVARTAADLDAARHACRVAVLRAIAAIATVAELDRVEQVLFMRGYIAAEGTFPWHTQALDAASEVLHVAFDAETAQHARAAIGVASLPSNGLAEIELLVALSPRAGILSR